MACTGPPPASMFPLQLRAETAAGTMLKLVTSDKLMKLKWGVSVTWTHIYNIPDQLPVKALIRFLTQVCSSSRSSMWEKEHCCWQLHAAVQRQLPAWRHFLGSSLTHTVSLFPAVKLPCWVAEQRPPRINAALSRVLPPSEQLSTAPSTGSFCSSTEQVHAGCQDRGDERWMWQTVFITEVILIIFNQETHCVEAIKTRLKAPVYLMSAH